ncbi:hypothetical protein C8J57DRAFT_1219758 [Mycena rebaudengoi]|nr:hypothetical protein C8J57DRAFT_1219758 [Mycena rebaudengoi]
MYWIDMPKSSAMKRPRGLWKNCDTSQNSVHPEDPRPCKRPRHSSEEKSSDYGDDVLEYRPETFRTDAVEACSTNLDSAEDWDDLKQLFAHVFTFLVAGDDVAEALTRLRRVIEKCHRILMLYEDPSVLWTHSRTGSSESPTAFHAIFGTALFLFGNLIEQSPALALPSEANSPAPYWLAAIDVFETGEYLPSRTKPPCAGYSKPSKDWRMAIVWGRTLVCIANKAVTLQNQLHNGAAAALPVTDQKYSSTSPFSAIAVRRPPGSRRIDLVTASPHALLLLAMDQFACGIFHIPRPADSSLGSSPASSFISGNTSPKFSRAKELYIIASEVLAVAERLPATLERQHWAQWADGVFSQIPVDGPVSDVTADMNWHQEVARARGRAWLVVGTSRVEEIEVIAEEHGWEQGWEDGTDGEGSGAYECEATEDSREGLERAIEFFESAMRGYRCKEDTVGDEKVGQEAAELTAFLAEALLTLGNLTRDEPTREELYQRAQRLGGDLELDINVDE